MADVLTAVAQGIATVTFNRPDVRNAIAREMVPSLLSALRDVGFREDVRCIVFRGAGEHFSAGGDVKSFGETLALAPHERNKMFQERVAASADSFSTATISPCSRWNTLTVSARRISALLADRYPNLSDK